MSFAPNYRDEVGRDMATVEILFTKHVTSSSSSFAKATSRLEVLEVKARLSGLFPDTQVWGSLWVLERSENPAGDEAAPLARSAQA